MSMFGPSALKDSMLAVLMGFALVSSGPIVASGPLESSAELSDKPDSRPEVTQHEIVPLILREDVDPHGYVIGR